MGLAFYHPSTSLSYGRPTPTPTPTLTRTPHGPGSMNSIRSVGLSRSLLAPRALAGARSVGLVRPLALRSAAVPLARGISSHPAQKKPLAIQELTPNQELEQLDGQRNRRPTSPHLDIYEPQLTWVMSGLHRATGCAAVGGACSLCF